MFPNITITDVDSPTLVCGSIFLSRDGRGNIYGDHLLWDSTSLMVSNFSSSIELEYEFRAQNATIDDFTQILRFVVCVYTYVCVCVCWCMHECVGVDVSVSTEGYYMSE